MRHTFLLLLLILAHVAHAQDTADLRQSDRLFAEALARWDRSTSPDVEQRLLRALALRQESLSATDPRVADAQKMLGRVHYNRGLSGHAAAEFNAAATYFAAAVLARRTNPGEQRVELSIALGDLGAALREQGRLDAATRAVCESLEIRHAITPPSANLVAASLDNLGRIVAREGDSVRAARLQRVSQRVRSGELDPDQPAEDALATLCSAVPTS